MDATCTVDECDDPADRKGYCQVHYMRQYRWGTTGLVGPRPKPCRGCGETFQPRTNRNVYCSERCRLGAAECETCGETFLVRDGTTGKYCSRECWYEVDRASRPCPICSQPFKGSGKTCSYECGQELHRRNNPPVERVCAECGGPLVGKKRTTIYCSRRCAMKDREDQRGVALPVGSRRRGDNGYVMVKIESGQWVSEHRHLMERLLGRPLTRFETVHHVNGNRSDNTVVESLVEFRSGNLELWSSAQPRGQRVEQKVEWAVELLQQYRPDLLAP